MFYLKNLQTNKYIDYLFNEVNSKKDAYGYSNYEEAFLNLIDNCVIVDEEDKVLGG